MSKDEPQFLLKNEKLKIEMKRSVPALVMRVIWSIILFGVLLAGGTLLINTVMPKMSDANKLPYILVMAGFCLFIALLSFLPLLFHYLTDYACITSQRVYGKIGFIHTRELDVPLDKVQSVSVDQGLMGKIFKYATIHIRAVNDGWKFKIVENYEEFRKEFYAQKDGE